MAACGREFFLSFHAATRETPRELTKILRTYSQRQILFKALSLLFDTLLTRFFEIFQGLLQQPFSSLLPHLDTISTNPVFLSSIGSNLSATLRELETGMKKFVMMAWEEKVLEFEMSRDEQESLVSAWLGILGWVRDEVKGFDRCFPEKVCG
jgi:hypothetical protein